MEPVVLLFSGEAEVEDTEEYGEALSTYFDCDGDGVQGSAAIP